MTAAFIRRLTLAILRSYHAAQVELGEAGPVVLTGANGAGKTNLIEAISLLAPGRGLRRATTQELAFSEGDGAWAVSAEIEGMLGLATSAPASTRRPRGFSPSRKCRIDRESVSSAAAFADHLRVVWLTPAMDPLFNGPASERRRFLDRLVSRSTRNIRAAFPRWSVLYARATACWRTRTAIPIGSTRSSTKPPRWRWRWPPRAPNGQPGCRRALRGADAAPAFPQPRSRSRLDGKLLPERRDREHRGALPPHACPRARVTATAPPGARWTARTAPTLLVRHPSPQGDTGGARLDRRAKGAAGRPGPGARPAAGEMTGFTPILLLDEIAAHLDPARRAALYDALGKT